MGRRKTLFFLWYLVVAISILFTFPTKACSDDPASGKYLPEGVYLKLTKEFYQALRNENQQGARTYTNRASDEYLRQISISSKFSVETGLQIIKQQERIIRLLEKLASQKD